MTPEALKDALCRAFCSGVEVSNVPAGLVVSTDIVMDMGDPVSFYISETPDGYSCEDDGDFIATAIATGTYNDDGARADTLNSLLAEHGAYLDRDTCQIRRDPVPNETSAEAAIRFLPAIIRSRDILMLSRDRVAASFADDVYEALSEKLGSDFEISTDDDSDNPADIILRSPKNGLKAALIYAANTNEKLMAALLRHGERHSGDAPVIAMLSDIPGRSISNKRFMMAQNRGLLMPFFNANRDAAIEYVQAHTKGQAA